VLRAEFPDCVATVAPAGWASWRRWLDAARGAGHRLLWEHVDPRRAGLASALLLGIREEVSAEETEAFMQTGTIHVLSISGMHVGLLAGVMMLVVRMVLVPRVPAAILVGATIVVYTLLAGAEPPAIRAMILVLILCASYALGREALGLNSLGAAALVVLALNPADMFRVGVQLSFLCVLGLIWFAERGLATPDVQARIQRLVRAARPWPVRKILDAWGWFCHLFVLGLMLWVLTLPLVMARFHLLSTVALVLNAVLWLPTLVVLCAGLGVLMLGGLVTPAAAAFGWCCDRTLALLQWAIEGAAGWRLSYFWVSGPADWWLAGFYGGLGIAAAFPRLRPPRRWCLALAAGWVAVGLTPGLLRDLGPGHRARLDCTFLSVDHGCAVLVGFPSGGTLLYDAGSFPSPQSATQSIAAALWSRGIRHLDAVVLSHADADHYNGLPGLLERFSVGVVYVSPVMFDGEEPGLMALKEAIARSGVPVRPIHGGNRLEVREGCQVEVLHPPQRGSVGGDNANSLVLAIEYLGRRVLLPGDLDGPGLRAVLAEEPWHCDVLLAPHHGSRSSDPPGLAQWCRPRWVVVSGGRRYDVRQTMVAYGDIGSQVLHTAELGSIDVVMEASGISVTAFRK
jgi:competence protein ComEC